ncbi:transcriptional repressor, LexA family [Citrifermentans bemidjiense Bem]|uniref:Transcriptional repressor, LexA family n=1 Tax=Citrifermentans bemidjiense (strain ATCC BAA-1014 / DSM 16622 / JCM 12645 / Bem) TaxID=404380 RepID=B5ECA2_CITBB|nr:transcriptional repressor LexA [Citrifermentans bemidjiense]ACH37530.1 transcriptional repressor, LexA family [Citrifermentans bemidjiense Bem]
MTPKQKRVLDFILSFAERHGFQPSQQEIASGCGFGSLGTVQHYLRALEKDGHLTRQWNAKRGLQLANPPCPPFAKGGTQVLAQRFVGKYSPGSPESQELHFAEGGNPQTPAVAPIIGMELPLVGIVAAGRPVQAFQLADAIEVPSAMAGPGNVVYEVRGDSMVEMGIMDGDYVAVHPQAVAETGQTVIAEVNGSITIKKYVRKGNSIQLQPANSAMSPIMVTEDDEFHIRGVLVGSMRFYKKWTGKSST